uniref:TRAP transporter large permease subunit n=1 Tax=candidate division WOR-3 bacterium TaxID=2052148 RepID=A0A7C2K4L7_UNCW3
MDWPLALLVMFGLLVIFMFTGMPVAFAFMATCTIGALLFWEGLNGLEQLAISFYSAVTNFSLLPIPMFILMGNIIFEAGIGNLIVNAFNKVFGKLPGRLSLLAIGTGTLLGAMIGISGASIAILGKSLLPEMMKRGYKKPLTLGPIVATGTLAIMIPPSTLAVVLGAVGNIPLGKFLIAIIVPGLILAVMFGGYILLRCKLDPSLAPSYEVEQLSIIQKIKIIVLYVLPTGIIIFGAIGVIFLGIATPSEAAALGALACYIVAALYKRLSWEVIVKSAVSTLHITVMVFIIIVGAISFSRLLASSGAIRGLLDLSLSLNVSPLVIVILSQIAVMIMGCFMDVGSIVMIVGPVLVPMMKSLGFDVVWYGTILLLNIQLGLITPPFGLDVYTLKALAPPDITTEDVFKSSMPFFFIGVGVMALILLFPEIATWLPSFMKQ